MNNVNLNTCLRNCIDASSQCFGCICEVLDTWWPADAPNCFKKKLIRALDEKHAEDDTENVVKEETERHNSDKEPINISDDRGGIQNEFKNVEPVITPTDSEEDSTGHVESLVIPVIIFIISASIPTS